MKYINIHTHHNEKPQETSIRNLSQLDIDAVDGYKNSYFSIGLHPWYLKDSDSVDDFILPFIKNKKCIAIGECGLDRSIDIPWELQLSYFQKQILLSEQYQVPLILHCVRAHQDIILLRKQHLARMPWILHGFNKSTQLAQQCLDAGLMLSIQRFEHWQRVQELMDISTLDKMFLESDDLDHDISILYDSIAASLHISTQDLTEKMESNFKNVFLQNK